MSPDILTHALIAIAQVTLIDVTLAGDNAVVIGMAVRSLEAKKRRIAILIGTSLSALFRIILALVASRLLSVIGLTLAGGFLLLWVCWKMYRELQNNNDEEEIEAPSKLGPAIIKILIADLSMSLDNVLAVAGATIGHPWILVGGLVFSVVLMGVAASFIAGLLARHRWIAWCGLLIVLFVAIELIMRGSGEVWHYVSHVY